jgi:Protein of unknown function (DUF2637)
MFDGVKTAMRERTPAWAIGLSLAVVASTTGFVSYTHISALTVALGQSWKTAHLYPLFIDGQIVIGSVIYMTLTGRRRWLGLAGIVPGVLESLFANWESASGHGTWLHGLEAHAWATVAAQAFAVSSFLFERWIKEQASANGARKNSLNLAALAADPETAARLIELLDLRPQATGLTAPEPEPAAVSTPVHLHDRPAVLGWGTAPSTPEPEQQSQGPAPARTTLPYPLPVPVMGPVSSTNGRPAARPARPRSVAAVPAPAEGWPALPKGAALRALLESEPTLRIHNTYGLSRYRVDQMKKDLASGALDLGEDEEVATDAA